MPPHARTSRPWPALAVAVAAMLGLAVVLPPEIRAAGEQRAADDDAHAAMVAIAPGGSVELDQLPAEHRELYLAAAEHREAFTAVRCYCGCEDFLDHPDLLTCFVRPGDGAWERHATGCGVCLGEARDVVADLDRGLPLDEIITRIDARYGGITT
ncbi:PCYCGC motif-containing (lipo)protein [Egicoccus halophilus]|uniref:Uncharacterized protein n=1 Tax=Egicoccus halophilus TaxID=1670830 RepID=A0A8J3AFU3_9ACTN|nr:PCYCGC motif-containing (lipo)protein [Egicoccus halophilus]GGI07734.1 hypothetical protein GCM10011354_25570 [Egicoccus halophilus]